MKMVNIVRRNFYADSLRLLRISEESEKLPGVIQAAIIMSTETNKQILHKLGLITEEGKLAGDSDMIIALRTESEEAAENALASVEKMLSGITQKNGKVFYNIKAALDFQPASNLALVSVPGEHARELVNSLLDRGLHIHLFSDHVPLQDEREMKERAMRKELLLLGPEAGTSIIHGAAIGFANALQRGPVGIVAAAGTGLQEVGVLLSNSKIGISHGLGVGGRDLSREIGGTMTVQAVRTLEEDDETRVITIVSKPADPDVQKKVIQSFNPDKGKKYVTCFIGGAGVEVPSKLGKNVTQTRTLHGAALLSARALGQSFYSEAKSTISVNRDDIFSKADRIVSKLDAKQEYVRGLFSGGTLAFESLALLHEIVDEVYSNTPLKDNLQLADAFRSSNHTVVDLGAEVYTKGRPHPMIDPTLRRLRLREESKDEKVAVIMMDFMLGYGCHPDPVGAHIETIMKSKEIAEIDGRHLNIVAHVCGTSSDPQSFEAQVEKLRNLGVLVLPTNALMSILAGAVALRGSMREDKLEKIYREFLNED